MGYEGLCFWFGLCPLTKHYISLVVMAIWVAGNQRYQIAALLYQQLVNVSGMDDPQFHYTIDKRFSEVLNIDLIPDLQSLNVSNMAALLYPRCAAITQLVLTPPMG